MATWSTERTAYAGGRFRIFISRLTKGGRSVEVTNVRGAPTEIASYGSGDPFGDASCVLNFPSLTAFDDWEATDLRAWMGYYSNVDIWWCPAIPADPRYVKERLVLNALTGQPDQVTPIWLRDAGGTPTGLNATKVWEGFLASVDVTVDGASASLSWQCQGALFQLDRYFQKPFFPGSPWPLEALIADAFSRKRKPHLRWSNLQVHWPANWTRKVPAYTGSAGVYTPVARPGSLWTAYSSRQTGSWDHALTGFVQDQLTVMITRRGDGTTRGNQWTVRHYRQGEQLPTGKRGDDTSWPAAISKGRQPVLEVRSTFRAPDLVVQLGLPGVDVHLSGDSTQSENIVYGNGTGLDGTAWRNAVISNDGQRTDYVPLAADREVFPYHDNPQLAAGGFVSEANTIFGSGFDQPAAAAVSAAMLDRDRTPGWTGTITLLVDPSPELPRWLIKAGMTLLLTGFAGSGQDGLRLHIAQVSANPTEGSVELTVDTRYRDLLTVEEARVRTRDPLTPVKMLQVNRSSVMIEDLQAPWDYSAGSGFIPRKSKEFFNSKPINQAFPYVNWHRKYPPLHYAKYYIPCPAGAKTSKGRWTQKAWPILVSEKGTIARSEIGCFDVRGNLLEIPFHVSFWYYNVTAGDMPRHDANYSPYQNNAFEKVDPTTGVQVNPLLWPDPSFLIGWGNKAGGTLNRAGFWPGRETSGADPTGLFVDDAAWQFDMTSWRQYFSAANKPGSRPDSSDLTIYAMFYAEHSETVYFSGRLFRQNPGSNL